MPTTCTSADLRVRVEELLDLAGIDVFAAADDDVARAAGEVDAAVLVHDAEVAGVQPAVRVDGERRGFGLGVVALHDHVATRTDFALRADGGGRAADGGDDFDFCLRHSAPDRVHADVDGIVGVGHGDDRRAFRLTVRDDQFSNVHIGEHALHQLDGAGRAGHHPGAQAGEIESGEVGHSQLGDVHGGHAVDRSAGFALDGHEGGAGVEG